jgi:hypothetical protein
VRGGSIDLLREHWRAPVQVVEFEEWTDSRRSEVHQVLLEHGQALLRVPVAARRNLRAGVIDLNTTPVEVGPLWCYPEVLGVHERGPLIEARLVLRETW